MKFNIVVLPGDGIGPEIIAESVKVMNAVGKKYGHEFHYEYALIGGVAIDKEGTALSRETIDKCK
jgi:3-isopropylmalate dehydrogenase